ncbi:hypothetical protein OG756_30875 [Streptomyces sp. NBC_01310]|uniref:hypothetical protein n=1 Tax=Streptomyces sp. NBC_01310 TaxID=2903820 RepID=UPI0035B64C7E|nr:hypothetical protein OG756_30875 [Streptomyces sp. NBC_01310]
MNEHSVHPEGSGKKARRAGRRADGSTAAPQRRNSTDGQIRSSGSQRSQWTADSRTPQIAPGTLDAATLLGAVTDTLRPVLEQRLSEMADSLAAVLGDAQGLDAANVLRAELLKRVLPQFTEAVRGAVVEGIRTRQMHLAQLAVIDRTAHQAESLRALCARIDGEISRAGLVRVTEPGDLSLFNLVDADALRQGADEPPVYSVVAPAYTDRESGKPVERGWVSVAYEPPAAAAAASTLTPGQKRRQHKERPVKQSPAPEQPSAQVSAQPSSGQAPAVAHPDGTPPGQQPAPAADPRTEAPHPGAGPGPSPDAKGGSGPAGATEAPTPYPADAEEPPAPHPAPPADPEDSPEPAAPPRKTWRAALRASASKRIAGGYR